MSNQRSKIPLEIIKKLKSQISFFANFGDQEMIELLQIASRREYKEGEIIFRENAEGDEMFVILAGDVKITKESADDKDILLASLTVGDCFGEMSMIDGSNRSAQATAQGNLVLLVLRENVLKSNLNLAYKLFKNFSVLMANRLRLTNKSYTDASADEAKNRFKFSEVFRKYVERGGSFAGANLRNSSLTNVMFAKCEMKNIKFVGAEIKNSRINQSNFDLSSFVGSRIRNAMFSECNFKGANFSAALLERIIFKNCNFDQATIKQLEARGATISNIQS